MDCLGLLTNFQVALHVKPWRPAEKILFFKCKPVTVAWITWITASTGENGDQLM